MGAAYHDRFQRSKVCADNTNTPFLCKESRSTSRPGLGGFTSKVMFGYRAHPYEAISVPARSPRWLCRQRVHSVRLGIQHLGLFADGIRYPFFRSNFDASSGRCGMGKTKRAEGNGQAKESILGSDSKMEQFRTRRQTTMMPPQHGRPSMRHPRTDHMRGLLTRLSHPLTPAITGHEGLTVYSRHA